MSSQGRVLVMLLFLSFLQLVLLLAVYGRTFNV